MAIFDSVFSAVLGGCDVQKVRMEIVVNGSAIISRTGSCQSRMKKTWVNLGAAMTGQIATVKLVDSGAGDWGYITFDDLRHGASCEGIHFLSRCDIFAFLKFMQTNSNSNRGNLPTSSTVVV